jgi:hypothetical protein
MKYLTEATMKKRFILTLEVQSPNGIAQTLWLGMHDLMKQRAMAGASK